MATLKSIRFAVAKCCGVCVHFKRSSESRWGYCKRTEYVHGKHGQKELGVPEYGTCENVTVDAERVERCLGSYADVALEAR